MLNKELEFTLNVAFKEAREKRHEFVTVEHLLLALLDNSSSALVLKSCGANIERLRRNLLEFINQTFSIMNLSVSSDIETLISNEKHSLKQSFIS